MRAQGGHTKAASRPIGQRRLHSAVLRDASEFASLKEEWDELYQSCPQATPFQSWEWLYTWWEVYGEGSYGLRLITLRDESGLLVGLLPLMVRRGRLLLLGGRSISSADGRTSCKDALLREGWEEPVAEAGVRALMKMGGWRVADLQELMPQAAAWELFRHWDAPKTSVPITNYVLIRAKSWEELLSSLSKNARKTAHRTVRRIEEDGLKYQPADLNDAERAARTLAALHRELLRGRRIDPGDLSPRYEAFMEAAARRMTARGIGRISEFKRDGTVLVSQFLLFDKDFVGAYVIGASEEASRRYQFNALSIWDAMNVARGRANAYVSLMDYVSWDKLRWASEVVRSQRAILGRKRASSWLPYAGYYVARDRYYGLRSEAQRYAYSEGAPRWVKNATDRYYALVRYLHSESAPRLVTKTMEGYYTLRGKYGYGWLRYRYQLTRVRREMESNTTSKGDSE